MSLDIFNDAFKSLSILNENLFDTSTLGVTKLHSFMDDDFEEDTVDIIDPDASTDEELSDSYIGKVIVDCNVCHSHIFKDRDELDIDESGLVNGEDMCPYCGEQEGFVIIGQIEAFNANVEEANEADPSKEPINEPEVDFSEEDEDEIEESLNESLEDGTLVEDSGDDLASRVLTYLDTLESNGELTEDVEPGGLEGQLDSFIQQNKPLNMLVKGKLGNGTYNNILKWANSKSLQVLKIDAKTIFPQDFEKLAEKSNYKVVVVDEFGRAKPDIQSKILESFANVPVIAYMAGNTSLDSAIDKQFDVKVDGEGSLTEAMNNVKVETDDNIVTVNSDESGKVTVTTEPVEAGLPEGEGEMIAPLSDEDMDSIMNADTDVPVEGEEIPADIDAIEEPAEDMPLEDEEVDIDMEEIDEESLDNLGESYLKKVYENVDSYKTNSSYMRGDKIIVEGVIKFTSGKEKKTGFILEAKSADNRGRVTFSGYNAHLTNDKSAYLFEGRVADKKLTFNKLSYRYALNENLISGRVYRR